MSLITGKVVDFIGGIESQIAHLPAHEAIIFDIAIILIVSAVLAFIARMLKQPLIPAYVLTGLVIGPLVFGFIKNDSLISAFSEIGIAFLLFTAGLEISFKKIKEANLKKILIVGVLQVALIFVICFFLSNSLGFSPIQSAYLGMILVFSSTMVDIKLLADSGEIVTLHGRLVIGILLLQDLAAIVAIVIFTSGGFSSIPILIAFIKLVAIIFSALLLQKFVLNKIFRFAARSTELLFLSALAVLFLFIIFAYLSKLSIVIGAFVAGVSLANSPFKIELESRISPLRDFFSILFFVALGMQIVFVGISSKIPILLMLLAGAFIIKPFVLLVLMRIVGYQPKTSFLTSITLAQLSEFSLILGMLGVSLGVIDISLFSTIILGTIVTMSITPYILDYKEKIYKVFKSPVNSLKFLPIRENLEYSNEEKKEILLVGAHRMGAFILKRLLKQKDKLLIVDYDPEIINNLIKQKISCIYGDLSSPELISKIDTKNLRMVVSTVPNYRENLHLLKIIKKKNPKIKVVVNGARISETLKLYEEGADYVITPKVLAGEELSTILKSKRISLKEYKREHLKRLNEIHNLLY